VRNHLNGLSEKVAAFLPTCIVLSTQAMALPIEDSRDLTLEELVVTARGSEEFIQDTPIAISAYGERSLENIGVSDLTDLRGSVPSLSIAPFVADRGATVLFMRGMGGTDVQTTKDSAVGNYLDGVALGRATGLATDIADLERIEVLRGVQGTLYGRNTTGGAINFITAKPNEVVSLRQNFTFGNYDTRSSKTSLNIPLADSLSSKISYMRSEKDGWVENTNNAPDQIDYYADEKQAARLAVRYLLSDSVSLNYAYDISDSQYGNSFFQITAGKDVDRLESFSPVMGMRPSETDIRGHNLTVEWELDSFSLKSITGYRTLDSDMLQNYIDAFLSKNKIEQDQLSQEIQAFGDFSDSLSYVAGVYFYQEHATEIQRSAFGFTSFLDAWQVDAEAKSSAIYGQGTWSPTAFEDQLRVTLGLRYTRDERSVSKLFTSSLYSGLIDPPTVSAGALDFSKFNPSVTVDYALTNDINGYAKISTGYKAGGFNARSTIEGFSDGFGQEEVLAYELGLKSDWLEQRVRINVAVFLSKFDDLQVDQVRPGLVFTDTLNAGQATMSGAEVELTALITRGLAANVFYTYLDAQYDEYIDNDIDLAHVKNPPYAPQDTAKLELTYEFAPSAYGAYSLSVNYQNTAELFSGPNRDTVNESYGIWNARFQLAGVSLLQGEANIALWGKNLSDEQYRVTTTNLGTVSSIFGTPRTYGIDIGYEY
jgi:iron complex outermembrane recepter protein